MYLYVGFIDLEKAYGIVNREALWQVLVNCCVKFIVYMLIV